MKSPRSLVVIAILAAGTATVPGSVVEANTNIHGLPPVVASAAADDLSSSADQPSPSVVWALARFDRAGLELPAVDIRFLATDADCRGNTGLAIHGGSDPRVLICAAGATESVVRRTLLHELAHVWAEHSLDDAARSSFMRLRGVSSWRAGPWGERGSEHAAEIITWALMERELLMLTLEDHDPDSLALGYEALTGTPPPSR